MSDQPAPTTAAQAAQFPHLAEHVGALFTSARQPYRVTVSVELVEGGGWSIVSTEAVDGSAFLALHTAAAAVEESLHVHPLTRDGGTRAPGKHLDGELAGIGG